MNPVTHIRETVFGCKTQGEFALILGTSQATVSRWEEAQRVPGHRQAEIREKALERGAWDDRWFFTAPEPSAPEPSEAPVVEATS